MSVQYHHMNTQRYKISMSSRLYDFDHRGRRGRGRGFLLITTGSAGQRDQFRISRIHMPWIHRTSVVRHLNDISLRVNASRTLMDIHKFFKISNYNIFWMTYNLKEQPYSLVWGVELSNNKIHRLIISTKYKQRYALNKI